MVKKPNDKKSFIVALKIMKGLNLLNVFRDAALLATLFPKFSDEQLYSLKGYLEQLSSNIQKENTDEISEVLAETPLSEIAERLESNGVFQRELAKKITDMIPQTDSEVA